MANLRRALLKQLMNSGGSAYRGAVRGAEAVDRTAGGIGKYLLATGAIGGGIGAGLGAGMEAGAPNGDPMSGAIGGGMAGAAMGPIAVPGMAAGVAIPPLGAAMAVPMVLNVGSGAARERRDREKRLTEAALSLKLRGYGQDEIAQVLMQRGGAREADIPVVMRMVDQMMVDNGGPPDSGGGVYYGDNAPRR